MSDTTDNNIYTIVSITKALGGDRETWAKYLKYGGFNKYIQVIKENPKRFIFKLLISEEEIKQKFESQKIENKKNAGLNTIRNINKKRLNKRKKSQSRKNI